MAFCIYKFNQTLEHLIIENKKLTISKIAFKHDSITFSLTFCSLHLFYLKYNCNISLCATQNVNNFFIFIVQNVLLQNKTINTNLARNNILLVSQIPPPYVKKIFVEGSKPSMKLRKHGHNIFAHLLKKKIIL